MNFFPLRAHLIGERENRGEKYAWLGGKEKGEGGGGGVKWRGSIVFTSSTPFGLKWFFAQFRGGIKLMGNSKIS